MPSWVGCFVLAWAGNLCAQEKGRLSETLLPDTTQGFVAISNVDVLIEHWNKTQLGHLMADPVMEPFTKDLHRQFENRWSSIHERLGLTLDDMQGVPGGDVGIGLIAAGAGKAALALVMDVTGKHKEAQELLKKAAANQMQRGGKRSEVKVEGCPDAVIQFDLPEAAELQEAAKSTLKGSAKSEAAKAELKNAEHDGKTGKADRASPEKPVQQAFYCLTGNLLVVTDHLKVMQGIVGRATGHPGGSLADHKPFQVVDKRCSTDAPRECRRFAGSFIRWAMPRPPGPQRRKRVAARARRSWKS